MNQHSNDVVLRNHHVVLREFYDAVRFQTEDVLPELLLTKKYTTRQLCGEAFWRRLSPGLRQQAGRCLAHLVDSGGISLVFASPEGKWPRRYRLPFVDNVRRASRRYVGPIPNTDM